MTLHEGLIFLRNVGILQYNTASKLGRSLALYFQTRNRQNLHTPLLQTTQKKWHAVQNRSAVKLLCGYGDLHDVDENFLDILIHLTSLLEHRRSCKKKE
jgi:hypothetical protein